MRNGQRLPDAVLGVKTQPPVFQIIVLGSGGGPNEDNVTGLLVRSIGKGWSKGSVLAVDAGVHLSSIIRLLDSSRDPGAPARGEQQPSEADRDGSADGSHGNVSTPSDQDSQLAEGPFAGLKLPHKSAKANAAFLTRDLISTYLITHPHLDHISAFVINTASFQNTSRPKRLAALPDTIEAIKTHVFNDVIWPNMVSNFFLSPQSDSIVLIRSQSDEDDGIGLVSYMRLAHGGNMSLGTGKARGYIEVCDGLSVRSWNISHGHSMKRIGRRESNAGLGRDIMPSPTNAMTPIFNNSIASVENRGRSHSFSWERPCPNDSAAFFIRDEASGKEILIFGDVEPDSISLTPRTAQVWAEAAPKISMGILSTIFIEVSFDDSQIDDMLFGHLNPRHLAAELVVLSDLVRTAELGTNAAPQGSLIAEDSPTALKGASASRKRKRMSNGIMSGSRSDSKTRKQGASPLGSAELSPLSSEPASVQETIKRKASEHWDDQQHPLKNVKVYVIHVKDPLTDDYDRRERILSELESHKKDLGLGCQFVITDFGSSIYV